MQVGDKFNKLTVISEEFIKWVGNQNRKMRKFLCDCGNECEKNVHKVKSGHTTSCGCWGKSVKPQKIKYKDRNTTKTKLYQKWTDLRKKHKNDIVVEWTDFLNFKDWSEKNSYIENSDMVLFRVDKTLPFGPNNCKFIKSAERHFYYNVNSPENVYKRKQTCIEKYGVDHPWKNKQVIQKTINTCIKKYGHYPAIKNGRSKPELEIQNGYYLWVMMILKKIGQYYKVNRLICIPKNIKLESNIAEFTGILINLQNHVIQYTIIINIINV